jgi:hypothetical protein
MKKIAIVIIFGILLIGLVGASLVGFLSNIITGNIEVKGPVFYMNGYDSGIYHDLLINEIPLVEEDVYLWNGQRLMFKTEELKIENFYRARFDIHIWAKTNASGNIMQFQVVRIKPNLEEEIICVPPAVTLTNINNFIEKETFCNSLGEITLNPDDKIGLIIMGAGGNADYFIRTGHEYSNGMSRMEVTAA